MWCLKGLIVVLALISVNAEEGQPATGGAGTGQPVDKNARLLVSKEVLNRPYMLVEKQQIVLLYNIYNVGGSSALNVVLSDNSIQPDEVNIISGMSRATWDRIPSGSNVTHSVVIAPIKAGLLNLSFAEVSYHAFEGAEKPQYGYTSAPGLADIMPYREYDRRFNPHFLDWAAFGVMTLPSLLLPFMLWYKSKSKYEGIIAQSAAKKAK